MEEVKFCPKCQKKQPLDATKCDCGYEFVFAKEQKTEADDDSRHRRSQNLRVINDRYPLWLWTFIGFISCSIAGWILYSKYKKDYNHRAVAARKGAIDFYITVAVVVVIYLLYLILNAAGKIV